MAVVSFLWLREAHAPAAVRAELKLVLLAHTSRSIDGDEFMKVYEV